MAKFQFYVTPGALKAVAAGTTTPQISVDGLEEKGSKKNPLTLVVDLKVDGTVRPVAFSMQDTHGIHPSHQTEEVVEVFGKLYAFLSKTPGRRFAFEGELSTGAEEAVEVNL